MCVRGSQRWASEKHHVELEAAAEKDSGQSHKQTNELICWLIEHRLSIKSLSMFAVPKNKEEKKDRRKERKKVNNSQKKGHERANWETEGGRL